jgi:hypothetical protein
MRLQPAVPFPNNQNSHFSLSHQRTPFEPLEGSDGCAGLVRLVAPIRERLD